MTSKHITSLLTLSLVVGAGLWAQEKPAQATVAVDELELFELLNTPVSGASKREQRLLDSPQAIEVLGGDEIRQMGIYRLQDALRLMTSIDVMESDLGYSVIGMRGVMQEGQPRTVQVLIDGVPLYSPMGAALDINNLPLPVDLIERIEVVRGPSSTLYGANAVVGVVAITTKKLDKGFHGDLRASRADKGTSRGSGDLRYSNGGFGILAGSSGASFGDSGFRTHKIGSTTPENIWITFDGADKGTGHQSDKAHQNAAYARMEWNAEGSNFWLSAGQSSKRLSPVGQSPVSYINYRYYEISSLLAGWRQTWGKTFSTEVRLHRMTNQAGAGPSPTLAVVLQDPAWRADYCWGNLTSDQIDLQANWNPSATIHFVFGADTRKILMKPSVMMGFHGDTKESASGGFVSTDWNLSSSHTLSVGLRAENESLGGSRISPRAVYVWNPGKNSVLRFAYLTSSRSPQIMEMRINLAAVVPTYPTYAYSRILPNPDLKPEKVTDFEIGYRHIIGAFTLDATVYQMKFTDLITQPTVHVVAPPFAGLPPLTDTQFQNSGGATNKGAELAASWLIQKGWTVGLNLAYVDFKKDNPVATDRLGEYFAYTTKGKANAWTRLTWKGWTAAVAMQYCSSTNVQALQVYGSPIFDTRDPIYQYHANLGYEFFKGLSVSGYVRNGAKEFTEQGASGPDRPLYYLAARREVGATLAFRF
jgi:outer membrane receptor for ferrienterochelin and colicin